MDRETLRVLLNRYLSVGAIVANLTPTSIDNQVVAVLQSLASSDQMLDLLLFLLTKFRATPNMTTAELVKAVNEYKAPA